MITASLVDGLCEWLSDMSEFSGYCFCTQYPATEQTTPVARPIIVMGTKGFTILPNTVDEAGVIITDMRMAESVYSIDIHVPRGSGGNLCYAILDRIMYYLLFKSDIPLSTAQAGSPEYIRNTDSLHVSASFTMTQTLRSADPSLI